MDFKINDYIMYKREVCKIIDIKENYYKGLDYFVLSPISDETLKIDVPKNSPYLKNLITKEEVDELIKKMPSIEVIKTDTKLIENEYKVLLNSLKYEDLIRIIKTTYLRNKERLDKHKKTGDKDNYYFNKAESYLYNEIAITLGLSYEEAKEYIIKKVNEEK